MSDKNPRAVSSRAEWRRWLAKHHASTKAIWLTLYKKHIEDAPLSYDDAVEEALCYGWVDGQRRRIDGDTHMIRFTPRRSGSYWALSNIARAKKLIAAKKMTKAGLTAFEQLRPEKIATPTKSTAAKRLRLPSDLRTALAAKEPALTHFQGYPPSFRRKTIEWVTNAKQASTRERRVKNVVANAAKHQKPTY